MFWAKKKDCGKEKFTKNMRKRENILIYVVLVKVYLRLFLKRETLPRLRRKIETGSGMGAILKRCGLLYNAPYRTMNRPGWGR